MDRIVELQQLRDQLKGSCACRFTEDGDELVSVCSLHLEWRDKAIAEALAGGVVFDPVLQYEDAIKHVERQQKAMESGRTGGCKCSP